MATVELTPVQMSFLRAYLDAELPDESQIERLFADIDMDAVDVADIYVMGRTAATSSIAALQAELEKSDDPNLERIARFGLIGLTGGNHVLIMSAILGYNTADAGERPAKAAALLAALDELEADLAGSALVALVEDNAWGVPVNIREPITKAINTIRRKLAT